jgi:hypothetical protein
MSSLPKGINLGLNVRGGGVQVYIFRKKQIECKDAGKTKKFMRVQAFSQKGSRASQKYNKKCLWTPKILGKRETIFIK